MKIDCINIDDNSLRMAIEQIKNTIFEKKILENQLLELKNIISVSPNKMTPSYNHYLQSLVYFTIVLANKKNSSHRYDYSNHIITELMLEIEKTINDADDNDIWEDKERSVMLTHALARAPFDCLKHLEKVADIFSSTFSTMLQHKDNYGFTPLNAACKEGNVNALNLIVLSERHLDSEVFQENLLLANNDGFTPLNSAHHAPEILHKLLEKIPTDRHYRAVNMVNNLGITPFNNACRSGFINSATIFLNAGTSWLKGGYDNSSPLMNACWNGHLDLVTLICEKLLTLENKKVAIDYLLQQSRKFQENALHAACRQPLAAVAEILLKTAEQLGEDVVYHLLIQNNYQGSTALMVAKNRKNYSLLDVILSYGARNDFYQQNFNEYTGGIYWGNDNTALTSLLYHAKKQLGNSNYDAFISQRKAGKTLSEYNSNPKIAERIDRYAAEHSNKEKVPTSSEAKNNQRFFTPQLESRTPKLSSDNQFTNFRSRGDY